MTTTNKNPATEEKSIRIRFRDEAQVAVIKKAAKKQETSFNRFVIEISERAANVLLKSKTHDSKKALTDAATEALSER
jgi:uncharacterized protein (DUF1778 family)